MKKTVLLLLLAFTFGCNKDDNNNNTSTNPIAQLLHATQVEANKIGCLPDGKVFYHWNIHQAMPLQLIYSI